MKEMTDEVRAKLIDALAKIQIAHRINVLDFAPQMNEDAHTKFLREILSHKRNGKQVFVRSFLQRMIDLNDEELNDDNKLEFEIEDQVSINGGSRRLDLRLESDNQYIVVESKVKGAGDGNLQMADYLRHCEEQNKDYRLIYLTLAGGTPAEWSVENFEKFQKVRDEHRYFERSYCDEVLKWLREDVLPNCLFSERMLYHSVTVYVDAVMRMVGGINVDDAAAVKAMERLREWDVCKNGEDCDKYGEVSKLREQIESDLKKAEAKRIEDEGKEAERQIELLKIRQARDVVTNLRDWMLRDCIYLDPWFTAYHLKYLLRNKPTPQYRNLGEFKVGCFKSIGQFTWSQNRYVELATNANEREFGKKIRIHLKCTPEGIRRGPYVFAYEMRDIGVSGEAFTGSKLFIQGENLELYYYPMDVFQQEKTSLVEVARHIERMIRDLEKIAPGLATND